MLLHGDVTTLGVSGGYQIMGKVVTLLYGAQKQSDALLQSWIESCHLCLYIIAKLLGMWWMLNNTRSTHSLADGHSLFGHGLRVGHVVLHDGLEELVFVFSVKRRLRRTDAAQCWGACCDDEDDDLQLAYVTDAEVTSSAGEQLWCQVHFNFKCVTWIVWMQWMFGFT